ncbi:MAG: ATP-binding protein [Saprospiraceae bacterium]
MKPSDLKPNPAYFLSKVIHIVERFLDRLSSRSDYQASALASQNGLPANLHPSPDINFRQVFSHLSQKLTLTNIWGFLVSLKLRVKILIALLVLFSAITTMGMLGGRYVQRTSTNAVKMQRVNYNSIKNTWEMSHAMNNIVLALTVEKSAPSYRRQQLRKACDEFERYLNVELSKVDSNQQKILNPTLKEDFSAFRKKLLGIEFTDKVPIDILMQVKHFEGTLQAVRDLNEEILNMRTQEASDNADRVNLYSIILGMIFFIFAVAGVFYLPNYLAEPIQKLTRSLDEVSRKNYDHPLEIKHKDEYGLMAQSFNQMLGKLAEFESINVAQILTEKKRTETIVSRMNEAIIGLDDNKVILFANPPALELVGMNEEDLIGQKADEVARKSELLQGLLKEVLYNEVEKSKTFPAVSIDKNGKRQYFNKDLLKLESQGDDEETRTNVGFVIILKNVTELKEHDLAKTNFMSTLSHELKTPISAIDMSLNLLEDKRVGDLNEEQLELSATIRQNTARLLKMVNEILDISRIETGKLQLNFETMRPEEMVAKALENVKTFLTDKHIEVQQLIEPDLPPISLDVHKTTAVLVNFLTNALRYTAENEVIEIMVSRQNSMVEFAVKDHGPGITEEEQRKLFQPYRRAAGDKTKGTGLGLAISKEFIEAQGGKIWVNSKVGKGSTFTFALPYAISPNIGRQAAASVPVRQRQL